MVDNLLIRLHSVAYVFPSLFTSVSILLLQRAFNMSVKLFTIVGDANVKRNMTGLNTASREAMKNAQVIDYLGVGPIDQALMDVRQESGVCIIAGLTEPLVASGDCGTIYASVDPTLTSLFASISGFSSSRPNTQARSNVLLSVVH